MIFAYEVCECVQDTHDEHEMVCSQALIYAETEDHARVLYGRCSAHPDDGPNHVQRVPQADRFARRIGEERNPHILRQCNWGGEDERRCDSCGLAPMHMDAFAVCDECGQCRECGCVDDCETEVRS